MSKKNKKDKKKNSANGSGNHHYIEAQYATGNRFMVSSIPPEEQVAVSYTHLTLPTIYSV